MKNFLLLLFFYCSLGLVSAQVPAQLTGVCTRDSLLQEPYNSWYQENYTTYNPDESTLSKLKKQSLKNYSIEIFFGTWCGDSRREVPRFLKIADAIGISAQQLKFIAVDRKVDRYKQAPGGETLDKGIYRVATFVILKNGKEVNRIVEHPVRSLELDLLDILSENTYTPNFKSYPLIDSWLREGLLSHQNTSLRGLAKQLKPLLITPSELNACGYVLMAQNKPQEAEAVFYFNAYIFYEDVDAHITLAETLSKNGKHQQALENIEYVFSINEDDNRWKEILTSYDLIKQQQK